MKHNLPTSTGDEAIPEVLSEALQTELSTFFCEAIYLCDDEALYQRFLTNLSGDGRRLIRRLNARLSKMIDRDNREA